MPQKPSSLSYFIITSQTELNSLRTHPKETPLSDLHQETQDTRSTFDVTGHTTATAIHADSLRLQLLLKAEQDTLGWASETGVEFWLWMQIPSVS